MQKISYARHRFPPELIQHVVWLYFRFPLSYRDVEDLLHERGIDICHETVRFWWNRFGPLFAAAIRRRRAGFLRAVPQWRWHLDEVFVRINGKIFISGGPSITKVKFSGSLPRNAGIARLRLHF